MQCKVCGKDLFVEIDFRTIFKLNYTIHESCKKEFDTSLKNEVIPIENNTITLLYFYDFHKELNPIFMEMILFQKAIRYLLNNYKWSIVLWMPVDEFQMLESLVQYLILKLCDESLIFLSLFRNM